MNRFATLLLASIFVIAGVLTTPLSAQADELPDSNIATVLQTPDTSHINVRTGPGTEHTLSYTIPAGTDVKIGCWTDGSAVNGPYGTSTVWYQLSGDATEWVSDAYLYTGMNDPVTKKCETAPSKTAKAPIIRTIPESTDSGYLPSKGEKADAIDCFINHQLACWHVKDAREWAYGVTKWKFPGFETYRDNMPDAFRHCAWIGAVATRFGFDDALHIGTIHEMTATDSTESDAIMDEINNNIGAQIGDEAARRNLDDQWGYVVDQCESKARNYELYGLDGIKGNY